MFKIPTLKVIDSITRFNKWREVENWFSNKLKNLNFSPGTSSSSFYNILWRLNSLSFPFEEIHAKRKNANSAIDWQLFFASCSIIRFYLERCSRLLSESEPYIIFLINQREREKLLCQKKKNYSKLRIKSILINFQI